MGVLLSNEGPVGDRHEAGPLSESVCTKNQNSTMKWKNTDNRSDERAVSPVIGVIMMVAVTVILAAVVSMLVLGMGSDVDTNPQASFSFEYDGVDTVTITHDGGDTLDATKVSVLIDGAEATGSWSDTELSAGDTYTNDVAASPVASGNVIKVVWTGSNGDTAVLATYTVP